MLLLQFNAPDYLIGLDFEVVNREDATDRRSIRNADFSAAAELD